MSHFLGHARWRVLAGAFKLLTSSQGRGAPGRGRPEAAPSRGAPGQGRRRRERSDGLSFTRSRTTRASPCNSVVRSCTWEMQLRTWGQVPEVTESIGNFRSANFGKFLQLTKLSITAGLPIPWFGILK